MRTFWGGCRGQQSTNVCEPVTRQMSYCGAHLDSTERVNIKHVQQILGAAGSVCWDKRGLNLHCLRE